LQGLASLSGSSAERQPSPVHAVPGGGGRDRHLVGSMASSSPFRAPPHSPPALVHRVPPQHCRPPGADDHWPSACTGMLEVGAVLGAARFSGGKRAPTDEASPVPRSSRRRSSRAGSVSRVSPSAPCSCSDHWTSWGGMNPPAGSSPSASPRSPTSPGRSGSSLPASLACIARPVLAGASACRFHAWERLASSCALRKTPEWSGRRISAASLTRW
jgi:hypothetical protein